MDPSGEPSDEALARRAQGGDADAFGALVRRHQGRVFRAAVRVAGNRADAEDAVQEAFVRAFRALVRFDPLRPFGAWVAKIAINRALTRASRRKPSASLEEAERAVDPAASPEAGAARAADAAEVRRAVDGLSASDRALLALRYDEGLPVSEIAATLGVRQGAVKVRLLRLRERLLDRLGEEGA
ncbi:MAG: sigma-70 family RNA polymerase sigma factor [Elusimicrobia bacterium]|nr:sigma-70 family RNA polymerase sigma factor [Elusimicrobiota bacterium]